MSSIFSYDTSEHIYVDLVSFSLFEKVFSKPIYRNKLLLRGSHLTRSISASSICRQPNDIDLLFYSQNDIFTNSQARQTPVAIRAAPADDYKHEFQMLVKLMCTDITNLSHTVKHSIDSVALISSMEIVKHSLKVLHLFPNEAYPSAKIIFTANCQVEGVGLYGSRKKQIDFAVDIGSGDPIVGAAIEASLVFPSLSTSLSLVYPAVNTSVLCAFKIHSSVQNDQSLRIKDVYDLSLILPAADPVTEHFKANLHLAFASRGDEMARMKRLIKGPYDYDIEAQWESFKEDNHLKAGSFSATIHLISDIIKAYLT